MQIHTSDENPKSQRALTIEEFENRKSISYKNNVTCKKTFRGEYCTLTASCKLQIKNFNLNIKLQSNLQIYPN